MRSTTTSRARKAARATPLALALLTGCYHPGVAPGTPDPYRDAEGIPLEAHAALRELLVVGVDPGDPPRVEGWPAASDPAVAGAQARLGHEVLAEARRLGHRAAALATPADLVATAAPTPPPEGDEAPVVRPPAPRPGAAWLWLRVTALRTLDAGGGPRLLAADFDATLVAGRLAGRVLPRAPAVARQAFTLVDLEPLPARQASEEVPPEAAAADAALERLVERAARRIAATLLATAREPPGLLLDAWCGLTERAAPPEDPVNAGGLGGTSVARWEAWRPALPEGSAAEVTYDLRAWRLGDAGGPVPLLSADGLSQRSAVLATGGAPAAWSVRGVATLPDGRRVATPWSQARPGGEGCLPDPEPALAHRGGRRRAPSAPPTAGPRAIGRYLPLTRERIRRGLADGLNPATGALGGAGRGAGSGLVGSVACGPLFPVCAAFMVPAGAVIGAGAGLLVGGVSSAVEGSRATDRAPVAGGVLGAALEAAARRAAGEPGLAALVEAAGTRALAARGAAGALHLDEVEGRLLGDWGDGLPTQLALALTVTFTPPGAPPVTRRLALDGSDRAPAGRWIEGGGALAVAVARAAAGAAGPALADAILAPEPAPPPTPEPAAGQASWTAGAGQDDR